MCAVGVVCLHSYSLMILEGERGGAKEKGREEGMGRGRGEIGNSNGHNIQYSVLSISHV